MSGLEKLIESENDNDVLQEVVKVIIRSQNEFWSSNITSTLLYPEFKENEGITLAEQWMYIARTQLRKEIGEIMLQKKLAQLRDAERKNDKDKRSFIYYIKKQLWQKLLEMGNWKNLSKIIFKMGNVKKRS